VGTVVLFWIVNQVTRDSDSQFLVRLENENLIRQDFLPWSQTQSGCQMCLSWMRKAVAQQAMLPGRLKVSLATKIPGSGSECGPAMARSRLAHSCFHRRPRGLLLILPWSWQ
jgi:hypothetical protein